MRKTHYKFDVLLHYETFLKALQEIYVFLALPPPLRLYRYNNFNAAVRYVF